MKVQRIPYVPPPRQQRERRNDNRSGPPGRGSPAASASTQPRSKPMDTAGDDGDSSEFVSCIWSDCFVVTGSLRPTAL